MSHRETADNNTKKWDSFSKTRGTPVNTATGTSVERRLQARNDPARRLLCTATNPYAKRKTSSEATISLRHKT
eukprot:4015443-Pyramimonas_sp.AAC.1